MDVSAAVVNPSYRSTPWRAEEAREASPNSKARILFISESNVCRGVLAEAWCRQQLTVAGLSDLVECESKGSRDYNVGDPPEPSVLEAASQLGLALPADFAARHFDHEADVVNYDLLVVMDKYTAADVLREVSVYDTISKEARYSLKVRRLGEWHPQLRRMIAPDAQDIEDALYGNVGGQQELAEVLAAAKVIQVACIGLVEWLQQLQAQEEGRSLRDKLVDTVGRMDEIAWLKPPLLAKS